MSPNRMAGVGASSALCVCWLGVLVAVIVAGCQPSGGGAAPTPSASSASCSPCACASGPIVDPALMAFLSKARAAHHQADLAESKGDVAAAIRALGRLTDEQAPGGRPQPPEVREVLADTRARLAELRSGAGDFDRADADIAAGLELAVEPTHFRGRLLEVRGLVAERRAAALESRGDAAGARESRERAVADYEAAMDVQEQVIAAQLGDAGAIPAPGSASASP